MKKKVGALLLAAGMMVSMNMMAFAEGVPTVGTGTAGQDASASVTKEFVMAEGIQVPKATFQFEITAITKDAPAATIAEIAYTAADQVTESQTATGATVNKAEKTSPIQFEAFPHTGVYEYTVKEIANTYTGAGAVQYAKDEYTLRVYVANDENKADGSVYVKTITAEKEGKKQEKIGFVNTYTKDASLTIEKQTTGALADKTKSFDFTIEFTNGATSEATQFTGKIGDTTVTCPVGQAVSFKLKHGQKLVFDKLPAGTRYVVTEIGAEDGYTPKVSVVENGTKLADKQGTEKDSLTTNADASKNNLVGEKENKVTFENTYKEVPITGVILNNLPFILLIGITGVAFAALAVLKRKKMSNR